MAFTKINAAGIGSTELVTLHSLEVLNNATVGGVLTYEDVTNVDSVGLITARNGIVVGSGITLSKDGDVFATGVTTTGSLVSSGAISATTGTFSDDVTITGGSGRLTVSSTVDAVGIFTSGGLGSTSDERVRLDSSGRLLLGTTTEGHSSADDLTIATSGSTASLAVSVVAS